MDFETAAQKLNDVLAKYFFDGKRTGAGAWDFYGYSVSAMLENDEFVVYCSVKSDSGDIFTPPPFRLPISNLKDADIYHIALRYISDWTVFLPVDNKAHPYYMESSDIDKFTAKRTA